MADRSPSPHVLETAAAQFLLCAILLVICALLFLSRRRST